jgi:phosphoribosylformylglycinamidine synthase
LQRIRGLKTGTPPRCYLERERDLHLGVRSLIHSGVVKSAHDCSEGGLAVALAECCISEQIARETPRLVGATIDLAPPAPTQTADAASKPVEASGSTGRVDALLFGETQARIIISVAPHNAVKVLAQAKILGIAARQIGTVGGKALTIKTAKTTLTCDLAELHDLWWNSIARAMR